MPVILVYKAMGTISARCVGSLFPRAGESRVHSVFSSAINLIGADPYPVTLLLRMEQRHPRAAVLESGPADLVRWGLNVGVRAVCSSGRLRFDAPGIPEIDLTAAEGFTETIDSGPVSVGSLAAALEALGRLQVQRGTRLRVDELRAPGSAMTRRFAEAFRILPDRFEEGAGLLVGLGEGLTPSGDDALVGWLASVRACGRPPPSLNDLCSRTNSIAASFLDAAEKGLFPAALVELAAAVARSEGTEAALRSLASIGHSSGLDAATGFLFGLEQLSARIHR